MNVLSEGVFDKAFVIHFFLLSALSIQAAMVSGVVQDDELNQSISDARVTLFTENLSAFFENRTDVAGQYSFSGMESGQYQLGVAALSFEYEEVQLAVAGSDITADFSLDPETNEGEWEILAEYTEDAMGGTNIGVLLADGRIMYCHDTQDPVILDPITIELFFPPESPEHQGCAAGSVLSNGRVIYVGGTDQENYGPGTQQVKSYDPITNSWMWHPDLLDYRWYPSMVQLPDGALLAAGGGGLDNPVRINTCEVMDPETMMWSLVDTLEVGNDISPIVLLYTGEVLMSHRPPQLYNPETQQWRLAADFVQGPRNPDGDHADHEMVLLPDGKCVAIGYMSYTPGDVGNLTEIYDPVEDSWELGANFDPVRSRPGILLLPDRKILVLGGYKEDPADPTPTNEWGYMALADLYHPATDSWRRLADMNIAREVHMLPILVPDGRMIVLGGEGAPGVDPEFNLIEAFTPPYLFRGVRPIVSNLNQTTITRGDQLSFTIERTNEPTSVILMGTNATTHMMESGNGRYLELDFIQIGQQIIADIPTEPVKTPIGHYILYIMVDDIPSNGTIIRIVSEADELPGDVNGDGEVNILDVERVVEIILGDPATEYELWAANLNHDTTIDVFDIILLVDLALAGNQLPEACYLEPDAGPCDGYFPRYYFDQDEQECQEFIWGGCEGVVPFETLEDCGEACSSF